MGSLIDKEGRPNPLDKFSMGRIEYFTKSEVIDQRAVIWKRFRAEFVEEMWHRKNVVAVGGIMLLILFLLLIK